MKKYLAIIPARSGSTRVPDKNIRLFCGQPLLSYSIQSALKCKLIDRVIVSTDDSRIGELAKKLGAEVPFLRPKDLATATATSESALIHVLKELKAKENYEPDAVVFLQATSPIRKNNRIQEAIEQFENESLDSLLSVTAINPFIWQNAKQPKSIYNHQQRPRSQDVTPENQFFMENGSIFIFKPEILFKNNNRLGGKIGLFVMDSFESHDIDDLEGFQEAERIYQKHLKDLS